MLGRRRGIENVGFAEREVCRMEVRRILVKKESEIRRVITAICDC